MFLYSALIFHITIIFKLSDFDLSRLLGGCPSIYRLYVGAGLQHASEQQRSQGAHWFRQKHCPLPKGSARRLVHLLSPPDMIVMLSNVCQVLDSLIGS